MSKAAWTATRLVFCATDFVLGRLRLKVPEPLSLVGQNFRRDFHKEARHFAAQCPASVLPDWEVYQISDKLCSSMGGLKCETRLQDWRPPTIDSMGSPRHESSHTSGGLPYKRILELATLDAVPRETVNKEGGLIDGKDACRPLRSS